MAENNNNKILNVPPLRFPEFTGEWKRTKVSDLLDFYPTNSLSWEQLDYTEGKIKNLHYGLIHKGVPTMVDVSAYDLPYIKAVMPKSYTICKEGDVAFADASEDTNDVAKTIEFFNCNNEQVVCGLHTIHGRDTNNTTAVGYKGYAFASDSFHKQIRRIAHGTKVFSISVRNFDEVFIGIPPRDEQMKIAKLLHAIDERIATQNKIIDKLQSLISGIIQNAIQKGLNNNTWEMIYLSKLLTERKEKNSNGYEVNSVSVSEGVINQIEYLGRSFAASDTSKYNVVRYGDIVYTKSPTGNFPYGIIKQSFQTHPVAVSPLYGVYEPYSNEAGCFLHYYFLSSIVTTNYLSPLIQKGAKNTINISNQTFLNNMVPYPKEEVDIRPIAELLRNVQIKLNIERLSLVLLEQQKTYLLRSMFI